MYANKSTDTLLKLQSQDSQREKLSTVYLSITCYQGRKLMLLWKWKKDLLLCPLDATKPLRWEPLSEWKVQNKVLL